MKGRWDKGGRKEGIEKTIRGKTRWEGRRKMGQDVEAGREHDKVKRKTGGREKERKDVQAGRQAGRQII